MTTENAELPFDQVDFVSRDFYSKVQQICTNILINGLPNVNPDVITQIVHLNGRVYEQAFPLWLLNWQDSAAQARRQWSYLADSYPRIATLIKGDAIQFSIPAVQNVRHSEQMAHQYRVSKVAERLQVSMSGIQSTDDLQEKILRDLMVENMSQYQRGKQGEAAVLFAPILRTFIRRLNNLCRENNLTWSLRHPLAFPSSYHDSIRILNPNTVDSNTVTNSYIGTAMQQVMKHLHKNNFIVFNFRQQEVDLNPENPIVASYWYWQRQIASAVINHNSENWGVALMPQGIPPFLFREPGKTAPMFIKSYPIPLISDQAILIRFSDSTTCRTDIQDEATELTLKRNRTPFGSAIDLLTVIATLTTLQSVTLSMGKGYHKPLWISSPLNKELIRILDYYIQFIDRTTAPRWEY